MSALRTCGGKNISIHALHEESDGIPLDAIRISSHFNPRSP